MTAAALGAAVLVVAYVAYRAGIATERDRQQAHRDLAEAIERHRRIEHARARHPTALEAPLAQVVPFRRPPAS